MDGSQSVCRGRNEPWRKLLSPSILKRKVESMKFIFSFLLIVIALTLTGCGLSSEGTAAVGQVKRIAHKTPLFCPDETLLDMSFGIMRNGTGSMSQEDMWIRVKNADQEAQLQKAAETGQPVKITYDVQRYRFCWDMREITKVELIK
jgi:hypothetical protein